MPAIYTDFKRLLESDPTCPMCELNVPPMTLQLSSEPEVEFKALAALMKSSGLNDEADGQGDPDDEEEEY